MLYSNSNLLTRFHKEHRILEKMSLLQRQPCIGESPRRTEVGGAAGGRAAAEGRTRVWRARRGNHLINNVRTNAYFLFFKVMCQKT